MKSPPSRKWAAWINLMPVNPPRLFITGEVETSASNHVPKLTEASPQGINPKILVLDLDIVDTGGIGTQAIDYRELRFEKPVVQGQYTQADILHRGQRVVLLDITEAH